MTTELLKERLPFLQAIAGGKTVECVNQSVAFDNVSAEYIIIANYHVKFRIKPEPQEWWLVIRGDGKVDSANDSQQEAMDKMMVDSRIVLVRKVL